MYFAANVNIVGLMFLVSSLLECNSRINVSAQHGKKYISQRTRETFHHPSSSVHGSEKGISESIEGAVDAKKTTNDTMHKDKANRLIQQLLHDRQTRGKHSFLGSADHATDNPSKPRQKVHTRTKQHLHKSRTNKTKIRHRSKKKKNKHVGDKYRLKGSSQVKSLRKGNGLRSKASQLMGKDHATASSSTPASTRDQVGNDERTPKDYRPLQTNKSTRKKKNQAGEKKVHGTDAIITPFGNLTTNANNSKRTSFEDGTADERNEGGEDDDKTVKNLKRIHIELVKFKILQLLRLERRPNITKPLPKFHKSLLGESALGDEPLPSYQSEPSEPSQAIIFANEEQPPCHQEQATCVYFDLNRFRKREVESGELWVYKLYDPQDPHYNHTFVVYELQEPNGNGPPPLRRVAGSLQTGIKRGWVKFELRNTVTFWADKPHRNHGIRILCKTCKPDRPIPVGTTGEHRPVLVVRFGRSHRRSPRGLSGICHARNRLCCKQPFTIDFKSFGWHDWIIFPQKFESGFCRGDCEQPRRMPGILPPHSQVLLKTAETFNDADLLQELAPCCVPTKMNRVSLLVAIDNMQFVKQDLELVVSECGCAL